MRMRERGIEKRERIRMSGQEREKNEKKKRERGGTRTKFTMMTRKCKRAIKDLLSNGAAIDLA